MERVGQISRICLLAFVALLIALSANAETGDNHALTGPELGGTGPERGGVVPAGKEATSADDSTDSVGNAAELLQALYQEITQLKLQVQSLQEDLTHHKMFRDDEEKTGEMTPKPGLIGRLTRLKREAGVSPSNPERTGNPNGSRASLDNRSRTLHGSHWITTSGGAVYIHWGKSDCRNGSELVYTGTTAGSYYSQTGSGANYLCMPLEPTYDAVEGTTHASRGLLYSAELETSTASALSDLQDHTPACAVCRAPANRISKLMLPGRNVCPTPKWRLEYRGYLMSGAYTHKKSEFICMDREAEAVPGTSGSQDGALFYMVEARCMSGGGLPCGPYVNGHELTCAVCTI